jgi:hypothetical protein
MMVQVQIDEDCPYCGRSVTLRTDADQPDDGWVCWDGDDVKCECGAKGVMSADETGAYLQGMACKHGQGEWEECNECGSSDTLIHDSP